MGPIFKFLFEHFAASLLFFLAPWSRFGRPHRQCRLIMHCCVMCLSVSICYNPSLFLHFPCTVPTLFFHFSFTFHLFLNFPTLFLHTPLLFFHFSYIVLSPSTSLQFHFISFTFLSLSPSAVPSLFRHFSFTCS